MIDLSVANKLHQIRIAWDGLLLGDAMEHGMDCYRLMHWSMTDLLNDAMEHDMDYYWIWCNGVSHGLIE